MPLNITQNVSFHLTSMGFLLLEGTDRLVVPYIWVLVGYLRDLYNLTISISQ